MSERRTTLDVAYDVAEDVCLVGLLMYYAFSEEQRREVVAKIMQGGSGPQFRILSFVKLSLIAWVVKFGFCYGAAFLVSTVTFGFFEFAEVAAYLQDLVNPVFMWYLLAVFILQLALLLLDLTYDYL